MRTIVDQNGTREEPYTLSQWPVVSFATEELLRLCPHLEKARQDFRQREDNEDRIDPDSVVMMYQFTLHGGDLEGGGLPLGSGRLIEAAKAIVENERAIALAIYNAVQAERERCAKIVEEERDGCSAFDEGDHSHYSLDAVLNKLRGQANAHKS